MGKYRRGFPLIELLVVIAIIGLLSSVVLASLNSARTKARVAAVGETTRQLSTVLALQYSETGSYASLHTGVWLNSGNNNCNSYFGSSSHAAEARAMCNSLISNGSGLYVSASATHFIVYVPRSDGSGYYFCRNHHGLQTNVGSYSGGWNPAACTTNPF